MSLTKTVKKMVFRRDGGKCQRCGKELYFSKDFNPHNSTHKSHIHHVLPQCDRGGNSLKNLFLTCTDCEREYHNKPPDALIQEMNERCAGKIPLGEALGSDAARLPLFGV